MIGYIYFVRIETHATRYKIGFSADVEKRMCELQVACPEKLELVGYVPGSKKLERQIHTALKAYRVSGEWFDGDVDPVILFIQEALTYGLSCALSDVFAKNTEREWQGAHAPKKAYRHGDKLITTKAVLMQREIDSMFS